MITDIQKAFKAAIMSKKFDKRQAKLDKEAAKTQQRGKEFFTPKQPRSTK